MNQNAYLMGSKAYCMKKWKCEKRREGALDHGEEGEGAGEEGARPHAATQAQAQC